MKHLNLKRTGDPVAGRDANAKRRRGADGEKATSNVDAAGAASSGGDSVAHADLLQLPPELLIRCVSFVPSASDRFALQTACRALQHASNSDGVLEKLDLVGDLETGKNCLLGQYARTNQHWRNGVQTSKAVSRLTDFALVGNLDAIYLLGMMATYCSAKATSCADGALLFRAGAKLGCPRCAYELTLIGPLEEGLRSRWAADDRERTELLQSAAQHGHVPAALDNGSKPNELIQNLAIQGGLGGFSSFLSAHYRFPEILRRGEWGREHEAILNTRKKRICDNPACGRWAWMTSRKAIAMLQNSPVSPLFFKEAATKIARKAGVAADHLFSKKRLKVMPLMCCGNCHIVDYCSRACQTIHWPDHKRNCMR